MISKALSALGGIFKVSGLISIESLVYTNYERFIVTSYSVGFSIVIAFDIDSLIGLTSSILSIISASEAWTLSLKNKYSPDCSFLNVIINLLNPTL